MVLAALAGGAGTGVLWVWAGHRYDTMCADAVEGMCATVNDAGLGLLVVWAALGGSALLTLLTLMVARIWPQRPAVLSAFVALVPLLVVYNVTGVLGDYRILLLAVVSALVQTPWPWLAGIRFLPSRRAR
ncbi:hypothetical protein VA596_06635 [Amycolatopsis sp., V23-08]|uniref:Uncharacterized protein n=1 Tax=Amycolatopsis heterodermiae TaxID=3110235 RepID=A0ABU5QZ82_9PSEU|nr:hypothetical protein [Amycolatopsis sp., V23-08]MEA5359208.1 hypothetical protein [Amycolatopsis sp., V23-08]